MSAYICIGGTIDGQYREMAEGVTHMRVAELLKPMVTPFTDADAAKKPLDAATHTYYLAVSKRHGFAWVHENYKGEF